MTKTTSRRAVLAGGASVAALSVPVIAAPIHPDAELLALGERFDALVKLYEDAEVRSEPSDSAFARGIEKLRETVPNSDEAWQELFDRIEREFPVAYPKCDDVTDLMDKPSDRIMELPAFTPEGLAVKARLARFACDHLWRRNEDGWDDKAVRQLVEAAMKFGAAQS